MWITGEPDDFFARGMLRQRLDNESKKTRIGQQTVPSVSASAVMLSQPVKPDITEIHWQS